jgi:hypothetical protein
MVPLRVLSRTNLADTSRRSGPNRRSFNALQPLCRSWRSFSHGLPLFSIACSLFLQNTGGVVSRPGLWIVGWSQKTPAAEKQLRDNPVGVHPRHAFASTVICATWRLYPLWPQSIAHTFRHHGGVLPTRSQLFPEFRCALSQPFARHSSLATPCAPLLP